MIVAGVKALQAQGVEKPTVAAAIAAAPELAKRGRPTKEEQEEKGATGTFSRGSNQAAQTVVDNTVLPRGQAAGFAPPRLSGKVQHHRAAQPAPAERDQQDALPGSNQGAAHERRQLPSTVQKPHSIQG